MKKVKTLLIIAFTGFFLINSAICFSLISDVSAQLPYDTNSLIFIEKYDSSIQKSDLIRKINQIMHKYGVNTFLQYDQFLDGNKTTELYGFIGNGDLYRTNSEEGLYQSFDPDTEIKLFSFDQIGNHSLTGAYYSNADDYTVKQIVEELTDFGVTARSLFYSGGLYFAATFQTIYNHKLYLLFYAGLVGLVFVIGYAIFSRGKEQSLLLLNGCSSRSIFSKYLRLIMSQCGIGIMVSGVFTVIFLSFYNRLRHFAEFTKFLLVFYLMIVLFSGLIVLLTYFASRINFNRLFKLKGDKNSITIKILSITTEALLVALIFILMSGNFVNIQFLSEDLKQLEKYKPIENFVSFKIGIEIINPDVDKDVGNFFREMDRKGKILTVIRNQSNFGDVPDQNGSLTSDKIPNSLVVNNLFFEKSQIYDVDGNQIKPELSAEPKVILMLPENKKYLRETAEMRARGFLSFQLDSETETFSDQFQIETVFTKSGQSICNFNDGTDGNNGPLLNPTSFAIDPIILLIPETYKVIRDYSYVSYSTQRSILLNNQDGLLDQELANYGVEKYFSSINNVSDSVNSKINDERMQTTSMLFGVFLSLCILVFTLIISSAIYVRQHAKILLLKRLNGYKFVRKNWLFILQVIGLPLLVVFSIILAGLTPLAYLSLGLGIVLIIFITTMVSTIFYEKRLINDFRFSQSV